jgi:hypothetical protein
VTTRERTGLVGRDVERKTLARFLRQARDGVSGALVIEGAAGIGKSALLAFAEHAGTGMQIARAAGVQPEWTPPTQDSTSCFCHFSTDSHGSLGAHRDALRSAFGWDSAPPRDRFFVGMAALAVLSDAAMKKPVLCLIDDAHLMDRASLDAIGFTARRMLADRLAMIFAVRERDKRAAALEGVEWMRLAGLEQAAAFELLASVVAGDLDDAVAERIVSETSGHPLAIIELARELSSDQLEGSVPVPDLSPLGERLEDLFLSRLRGLPNDVQRLLLLLAADPSGDKDLISRAAEWLGLVESGQSCRPASMDFCRSCRRRALASR